MAAKLFDMEDLQSAAQVGFLKGATWALKNPDNLVEVCEAAEAYAAKFPADLAEAITEAASADQ